MTQTGIRAKSRGLAVLDWTNHLFEFFSMACLVTFSIMVFVQMAARNLFNLGLAELEELSRSFDISMVFLIVPILMREGQHIAVDLFMGRLPARIDKLLKLLTSAICIAFSGVFLYSGYLYMARHWNVPSPVLKIPNIVFFGAALVGMALFLVNCVVVFALLLKEEDA